MFNVGDYVGNDKAAMGIPNVSLRLKKMRGLIKYSGAWPQRNDTLLRK